MGPEEMGAALGAGWRWDEDMEVWWDAARPGVAPRVGVVAGEDGWSVVHADMFEHQQVEMECRTPEQAVAVAHLLVMAEKTAAGADPPRFCGEDCAAEREAAYARGRDEERAAVVATLRATHDEWGEPILGEAADAIERGNHVADEAER